MTVTRRLRYVPLVGVCAGLLLLTGCSTTPTADAPDAPPVASSNTSDPQHLPETQEGPSDSGGSASGDAESSAPEDPHASPDAPVFAGPTTATEPGSVQLRFISDVPAGNISADELADYLGEGLPGEVSCVGSLNTTDPGAAQDCTGPSGRETPEATAWQAIAVSTPNPESPEGQTGTGIVFVQATALAENTSLVMEDLTLTGSGVGGMYGVEPVDAETLARDVVSTLSGDYAYVPLGAGWQAGGITSANCDHGLDFEYFAPVLCTVERNAGTPFDVAVLPAEYIDNDRGLLIGIIAPE